MTDPDNKPKDADSSAVDVQITMQNLSNNVRKLCEREGDDKLNKQLLQQILELLDNHDEFTRMQRLATIDRWMTYLTFASIVILWAVLASKVLG